MFQDKCILMGCCVRDATRCVELDPVLLLHELLGFLGGCWAQASLRSLAVWGVTVHCSWAVSLNDCGGWVLVLGKYSAVGLVHEGDVCSWCVASDVCAAGMLLFAALGAQDMR
jgi:hypothetical protein